jgi:formylglycine-generating enzyme required for sulfatase activity
MSMTAERDTHPPADVLRQFGLGKLTGDSSATILSHLEQCTTCREQVAALSGDSFLDRLRAAAGRSVTPMPDKPVDNLREKTVTQPGRSSIPGLPPELANHPQYEVVKELGRGGMGVVYLARNRHMDRLEVLKVMGQEVLAREGARQRFEREIKSAARLNHPNVVAAHSVLPLEGLLVFAMEYVEGQDLAEVVKARGPLPVANACYYTHQAALGLEHARDKGMVHRDVKPQNLILARDRKKHVVKVLDFGLAKATSEKGGQCELTGEGKMLGTPQYIAPEQIDDASTADTRADIYSLGCTLYYLLSGSPPFAGNSLLAILHAHHSKEAVALNEVRPEVPEGLAAVVRKMMAKDPAQRYQTPGEVAQALVPFIKAGAKPAAVAGQPPAAGARSADVWKQLAAPAAAAPAAEPAPRRRRPTGVLVAVSLAGLAAAVLAGVVVFWQTPQGMVKIESDDPAVAIVFDKTGPTVQGAGKEPIPLGVGEHGVYIKLGDLEFETEKFELKKGATVTLRVELLKDKILATADGRVIGAKVLPPIPTPPPKPGEWPPKTFTNSLGMEFVLVPKGKSWLGGTAGHPGDKEVTIARDFYLGKYEVTQEEWEKLTELTPSYFSRAGGGKDAVKDIADAELKRFPVEQVSWDDAQVFLERLNKQEKDAGWVYRLPKGVEWEYACRGGPLSHKLESAYDYYFDNPTNHLLPEQLNFALGHLKGLQRTCKVGSYQPNRLGLYDMHGNVWEWCDDAEKGADGALNRMERGGSWTEDSDCRALDSHRYSPLRPSFRILNLGLRVARVPAGQELVQAGDAVLVVEMNEPYADVYVNGEQVNVVWQELGMRTEIHRQPGTYVVAVRKDGFSGAGGTVKLEDGQRAVFTAQIERLPSSAVAPAAAPAARQPEGGYVQLFNGKDLTGWKAHPDDKARWVVEDGLLVGRGPKGQLFSERGDYQNFIFRVEAMINDKGNSGQYFRTTFGPSFPRGYEAQINSTHGDPVRTGSLYPDSRDGYSAVEKQKMIVPGQLHKSNEWFSQEVIAVGNHIVIKVDGNTVVDFVDEKNRHSKGHFALQQHDPGTVVKFRKIEVKELPPG